MKYFVIRYSCELLGKRDVATSAYAIDLNAARNCFIAAFEVMHGVRPTVHDVVEKLEGVEIDRGKFAEIWDGVYTQARRQGLSDSEAADEANKATAMYRVRG